MTRCNTIKKAKRAAACEARLRARTTRERSRGTDCMAGGADSFDNLDGSRSQSLFFFFQAEDGIRDVAVTGVQTCALPIYPPEPRQTVLRRLGHLHLVREEAVVAVARVDPEAFRRFLGEEPRRLIAGRAAEEEARAEANRARARRDEVRQVAEARKVAVPPFARDELGEGRLGG